MIVPKRKTNLDELNKRLQSACDPAFKKNIFHRNDAGSSVENSAEHRKVNTTKQPWFDEACEEMRNILYHHLNRYRSDNSDIKRQQMVNARSEYKKMLGTCRNKYNQNETA